MSNRHQSASSFAYIIGCFLSLIFAGCNGKTEKAEKAEPKGQNSIESNLTEKREAGATEVKPFKFPDEVTEAVVYHLAAVNDEGAEVFEIVGDEPVSFELHVGWSSQDLDYVHELSNVWEIAKDKANLGESLFEESVPIPQPSGEATRLLVMLMPVLTSDGKVGLGRMEISNGTQYEWTTEPINKILPDGAAGMSLRRHGYWRRGETVRPGETKVIYFRVIGFLGERWLTYTLTATGLPDEEETDESK